MLVVPVDSVQMVNSQEMAAIEIMIEIRSLLSVVVATRMTDYRTSTATVCDDPGGSRTVIRGRASVDVGSSLPVQRGKSLKGEKSLVERK